MPKAAPSLAGIKGPGWDGVKDTLEHIGEVETHITAIFPEATNETVTFTAGGTINTFGSWVEIADNNAVKFTTKFASLPGHIGAFLIEDASVVDKVYLFELSYSDSKTIVTRFRFIAGEIVFLPPIQQMRVRAARIPAGEIIYYRMACETANATCQLSIRYYLHD